MNFNAVLFSVLMSLQLNFRHKNEQIDRVGKFEIFHIGRTESKNHINFSIVSAISLRCSDEFHFFFLNTASQHDRFWCVVVLAKVSVYKVSLGKVLSER